MADPILVAQHGDIECHLLPALANRHGLITGATGTGKTITLQTLAENFSRARRAGVHGRRQGRPDRHQPGRQHAAEDGRGAEGARPRRRPSRWPARPRCGTCSAKQGHPVRATVSDMGPLLLARMLALNETQAGVLQLVFKIADDNGLLLLDLKDLRAMLQHVGDNAGAVHDRVRQRQRRPASAPSSAGCCRSSEQGGEQASSASRCSTSPTSCRPSTARASSTSWRPTS